MIRSWMHRQKLVRAITHDLTVNTKRVRKRLLSENNADEFHLNSSEDNKKKMMAKHESRNNDLSMNNDRIGLRSLAQLENDPLSSNLNDQSARLNGKEEIVQSITVEHKSVENIDDMFLFQSNLSMHKIHEEFNDNDNNNRKPNLNFLIPSELSALINTSCENHRNKTMLIDCGFPLRFHERRIKYSFHLNINDKLSRKRLITRGLKNFLDQELFERLHRSEIIILYDDSTRSLSGNCHNSILNQYELSPSIKCLTEQIYNHDSKKMLLILQCTYEEFEQQYRHDCEIIESISSSIDKENLIRTPSPIIDIESFPITEIIPGLFLGNINDARNRHLLEEKRIRAILNISTHIPCYHENDETFKYLQVQCQDSAYENILIYFETAFRFIEKNLSENRHVLVHCHAGISRSPSFVIGFIMKSTAQKFEDAYNFVKSKRRIVNPNLAFIGQLKKFEDQLIIPKQS